MPTSEQQLAVTDDLASPQAKLVYLSLLVAEEATVTQLQDRLGLSKLTLLPILTSLATNDYIRRTEGAYASQ